ncbi:YbaK/EbsC family protein [Corynebacterium macginleyi]|uniref:YbaK/EbsC family protein n=1 Tax=Corynebacterium macginleyi TaxID=38290 RepID=UPI001909B290|nr:YbaK/EbsC family protein [Corynebacterium macginleyi]MBK4145492.1 deacylase [Corynebacterium macginleyi]MBM0261492.1 deacylase [Corynebacterium macginleyi]
MRVLHVNPGISDTATFLEETGATAEQSLNSTVVSTKLSGERHNALVLVPATHRLDNRGLKRALGGKTSFLPMDEALALTGMEKDSIGPIGIPEGLPVVADLNAIKGDEFYIGGGRLGRKYVITRQELVAVVDQNVVEIYIPIE